MQVDFSEVYGCGGEWTGEISMKTHALIFAGGTGQRMSTRVVPKQFLELHGKPVIIYTLEHFEEHIGVDDIVIVCLEKWIKELKALLSRYEIKKVLRVVPGGSSGTESIYNGLEAFAKVCGPDDIVLIHDGVRPLINEDLITKNIEAARQYGTAITVEAVSESVVRLDKDMRIVSVPPRSEMYVAKAPQTFRFSLIWDLYQRVHSERRGTIDSAHLCSLYGVEMHTIKSSPNNIKITAPQDFYIFRALYEAMENAQFLGFEI